MIKDKIHQFFIYFLFTVAILAHLAAQSPVNEHFSKLIESSSLTLLEKSSLLSIITNPPTASSLTNAEYSLVYQMTQELSTKGRYADIKLFLDHICSNYRPHSDQIYYDLKLQDQLALAYGYTGKWDSCRMVLEAGIELMKNENLQDSFPQFYNNLGYVKTNFGENPTDEYKYALILAERKKDLEVQISALNNLSRVYRRENNLKESLDIYEKLFTLMESKDLEISGFLVVNYAEVLMESGDRKKALDLYKKYESRIQGPDERRTFYYGWGEHYLYKEFNPEKGLYYTDLALQQKSNAQTSKLFANKANCFAELNQFNQSLEWQHRAIESFNGNQWSPDPEFQVIYTANSFDQFWYIYRYAYHLLLKELNTLNPSKQTLQKALKLNDHALEILKYFQTRLNKEDRSRFSNYIRFCTELTADIYYAMYKIDPQESHLMNILIQTEIARRTALISQHDKEQLARENKDWQLLIKKEEQLNNELLALKIRNPTINTNYEAILDSYMDKKRELQVTRDLISGVMSKRNKEYEQSVAIRSVQNKLKPNELILNYFVSNHAGLNKTTLYLIVMSRDTITISSQPSQNEIEGQILRLTTSITKPSKEYKVQIDSLSDALLSTFKNNVQHKDLIIIPDKYLNHLPFEVLIGQTEQLLYETNSIRYAPGISHLLKESKPINTDLIGFAPATEYSSEVLYGSIAELNNLSKKYQGNYYTHDQATEKIFKKEVQNYGFIHLSTHSVLNEFNSENSYLYLYPDPDSTEDGRLYVDEINNMHIPAFLVVLGSCNSGMGKIYGDGIMSLAKSFINAGTQNIIQSLWPLEDQSASFILNNFYDYLEGGQAPSTALKNAKINYINTSPGNMKHPYYWAGFLLTGLNDIPYSISTNDEHGSKKILTLIIIFTLVIILSIMVGLYLRRGGSANKESTYIS